MESGVGEPVIELDTSDLSTKNTSCLEDFIILHQKQLQHSGVPPVFWRSLFHKLTNEIWDLADHVAVNRVVPEVDPEDVGSSPDVYEGSPPRPKVFCAGKPIKSDDENNIFLIDHAWTFDLPAARNMLMAYPGLLQRMCDLMDVEENDSEGRVKDVLNSMWTYVNTYSVNSPNLEPEMKLPRWYIMDEIGSRIGHSDDSNCRVVPFYYITGQITYSILFPTEDIEEGTEITRDFVEDVNFTDQITRTCRLLPWIPTDLGDVSFEPRPVPSSYFQSVVRMESLPEKSPTTGPVIRKNRPLKVFSEYEVLSKFLTDARFSIVDSQADADILWYRRHFHDFLTFSREFPEKFCNQFPNESLLTCKDLLAIVCRNAVPDGQPSVNQQTLESSPVWLPTTYNLDNDLADFVSYYRARAARGLDNLWICKPWNLARSLDITISDSLDCLLRLPETGPKLCSKYIEHPVLFHRADILEGPVKFDLRFIVLLKSVEPLRIGIYKRFWLRFANKAYALNDFDVYDKHFTVMNYGQAPIHQMFCHDFVKFFEDQNKGVSWSTVEADLYQVVREVFKAAIVKQPPEGLVGSPQSRAVYGLDFMLKWKEGDLGATGTSPGVQPMLLEINFTPDCQRACDYYSDFYNDMFSYLFLDEEPATVATL